MKVLFLTSSPLHKMHMVDMYINEISQRYTTEILDVSKIYEISGKSDFTNIIQISTLEELCEHLDKINENCVVITNVLIWRLDIIYPILKARRIPCISIDKESMIFWLKENYEKRHRKNLGTREKRRFLFKSIPGVRQVYSYLEYHHVKFDYILGAFDFYPDARKHFVHIHSLKYDEYIRTISIDSPRFISEKYILFLDAGLAHLPALQGQTNSLDKNDYLSTMNAFFTKIEQKYGLPVVIAAHPKSGYLDTDFEGRQIICYKTSELIKHAELVLSHYSTSLIEVVLLKKKVIFLFSEEYLNSASRTIIETTIEYSKMLNSTLVDVRQNDEFEITFDETAYNQFTSRYLVNERLIEHNNAELILKFLQSFERPDNCKR